MKLYIAYDGTVTLCEGYSENLIGVFSTIELAINCLKKQSNFKRYKKLNELKWEYLFDGEMTQYYFIREEELDAEKTY